MCGSQGTSTVLLQAPATFVPGLLPVHWTGWLPRAPQGSTYLCLLVQGSQLSMTTLASQQRPKRTNPSDAPNPNALQAFERFTSPLLPTLPCFTAGCLRETFFLLVSPMGKASYETPPDRTLHCVRSRGIPYAGGIHSGSGSCEGSL